MMEPYEILDASARVVVACCAAPVAAALVAGALAGWLQSALHISEPVLSSAARLIAGAMALWAARPLYIGPLVDLATAVWSGGGGP